MNKLILSIFLSIFLIGTVSAWDIDNAKEYDAISKTATFTNWFGAGDKIADVRLDAVPVYNEEFGTEVYLAVVGKESKFAEFTITPTTDYSDILKEVSFYDIRTSKYITKPVIAKVKSLELVNKEIYDDVCNFELNGTLTCSRQLVGTEKVEEEVYLPIEKVDITSGKEVTIALYTEIKNGDYFDYVPKFFGQDVPEWALVASDTQLMTYLSFNDNSGVTANNSKNERLHNATLDNANQWNATNKKIGASALQVRDVASNMAHIYSTVPLVSSPTAGFTISTWAYRLQAGADNKVFGQQTGGFFMGWNSGTNQFTATYRGGGAVTAPANTTINVWELWTVTVSNTNWTIYKNGYAVATNTITAYSGSGTVRIGNIDNSDTDASMFNGTLDEFAIWNRSLTDTEVSDLWNNGSGLAYPFTPANLTKIDINQPTNNSYIYSTNATTTQFTLNFTAFPEENASLGLCYYNSTFNSALIAVACDSANTITVDNVFGKHTFYIWSNVNTESLIGNQTTVWLHRNIYDANAYETDSETFSLELWNQSVAPYNGILNYNGTNYSATTTNMGNSKYSFNTTIDISSPLNKQFNYYYINDIFRQSTNLTQSVGNITFGLCNSTLSIPYLNISFKNETTLQQVINASIPSSTFTYWLGSGNVNKNYTMSTTAENMSYTYCFAPANRNLQVIENINYVNTLSAQRTYISQVNLSNTTTQQTLYLLPYSLGSYVTIQIINPALQPISGVDINVSSSTFGLIETKTTDASGASTFFLNPLISYNIVATKSGLPTFTTSIVPTQSEYTLTMGVGSTNTTINDYFRGITFDIEPTQSYLTNNTDYNFNFTIGTDYWTLDEFGITLTNASGTLFGSDSSTNNAGGVVSLTKNTGMNQSLVLNAYWVIEGNYTNVSKIYVIYDSSGSDTSLLNLKNRIRAYIDAGGVFGLTAFGLNLLVFLFIFITTGVVSYKFGFTSPAAVFGVMFILTLMFDLVNFISYASSLPEDAASIMIGILFLAFGIKEAMQ